jgi:hypothetical protein
VLIPVTPLYGRPDRAVHIESTDIQCVEAVPASNRPGEPRVVAHTLITFRNNSGLPVFDPVPELVRKANEANALAQDWIVGMVVEEATKRLRDAKVIP